jgi:predicted RND superfamily exporter protein
MASGAGSQRSGLFLRLGEYAARRKGFVFAVTALLVLLSSLLAARLRLDTDILELVPRGNAKVDAFKTSLKDFGGIDYLLVLLEAPEGRSAEDFQEFADLLAERLSGVEGVQSVEHRVGGGEAILRHFRRHALLFLPPEQIQVLEERLSERGIRDAVAEDRRILESPSSAFLKDLVRRDPLGIGRLVLGRLLMGKGALRLNPVDGYYMSEDGSSLLVLVKPRRPAQDLGFTAGLLDQVRAVEAAARRQAEEEGIDLAGLRVQYGGSYVAALEDSELIRGDVRTTALLSFAGVIGLYLVGYRRLGAIMYSCIPLMVGQALTFALASLALGRLNSASSGFVAMLMGLGTDFTIVMYARYVEERLGGRDLGEAVRRMMGEATLGVFTGAITSCGTFYAMCTTKFLGLKELGFLLGSGILLCLVAIVVLLPAMIEWNEGSGRRRRPPARLHVQSFGLEHVIPVAVRHRRATLAGTALLAAFLAYQGWNVGFSDSVRDLRSPNNSGAAVSDTIAARFGGNLNLMMAIIEAPTVEEALDRMRAVQAGVEPFEARGEVRSVDSLLHYLPPAEDQRRILEALRAGRGGPEGAFAAGRVERSLRAALAEQGFRPDAFDEYLPELRAMLEIDEPVGLEVLRDPELRGLLGRYIRTTDSGYRAAVYLYLEQDRWRREAPPGLPEAAAGAAPGVLVTGVNVVSKELRTIFARDSKRAVALGIVLVTILLVLDLRSFRMAMLANAQVLGGIVMMLGLMRMLDIEMNFVNAFTATMILGVGVDYGIHIIHRMRASGGAVDAGLLETGKAVAMAALTNVAGFGSLCFSNFPGMRSVGLVAVLGTGTCLMTALTFLPAALARPAAAAGAP